MSTGEGAWGKGLADMMSAETRGQRGREGHAFDWVPKSGEKIRIRKVSVREGQSSAAAVGISGEGVLLKDLALGQGVLYGSGQTSPVRAMKMENGKVVIQTETSIYEITPF